ncbi:serine hydrolase domain-containing protein [Capnocytophaga leadbetteri]|uniref:serine hydrolase domain-containing protein n=1 Tax=Capnocytophaga leadbetteri TaxID=327575 RepID=UPI0028E70150|nr:serine hydrolase domain-containing protein [Capnocytophaga leadbetteri]
MKKLTTIIVFSTIISFFNTLFGQRKLSDTEVFKKNPSEVTSFEEAKTEAEKILYYLIQEEIIPGSSVTVTKQGKIIWQGGYGYADISKKTPVDPQKTIFRVASMSKAITGVLLARLQEQKKFDWNLSLYEYVPNFPPKPFDFTIKQLAGHLAGIRSYKANEYTLNKKYSIEEGIDLFKDDILQSAPGTKFLYSSYGINLISLAIEKCLNKKFEDIAKEEVFKPLNMWRTFPDRGKIITDEAIPYTRTKKGLDKATEVNNYFKLAGGGFLSTSHDIAKMGTAIERHSFLSQAVENEMLKKQCTTDDVEINYGIGWQNQRDWNGRDYFGHTGMGVGGFGWLSVYPNEQVVIVMLFNVTDPQISIYLQRLTDFILEGAKLTDQPTLIENP